MMGVQHGQNLLIFTKIRFFLGAFAPITPSIASPLHAATAEQKSRCNLRRSINVLLRLRAVVKQQRRPQSKNNQESPLGVKKMQYKPEFPL
jgi:hypothetical protein